MRFRAVISSYRIVANLPAFHAAFALTLLVMHRHEYELPRVDLHSARAQAPSTSCAELPQTDKTIDGFDYCVGDPHNWCSANQREDVGYFNQTAVMCYQERVKSLNFDFQEQFAAHFMCFILQCIGAYLIVMYEGYHPTEAVNFFASIKQQKVFQISEAREKRKEKRLAELAEEKLLFRGIPSPSPSPESEGEPASDGPTSNAAANLDVAPDALAKENIETEPSNPATAYARKQR